LCSQGGKNELCHPIQGSQHWSIAGQQAKRHADGKYMGSAATPLINEIPRTDKDNDVVMANAK